MERKKVLILLSIILILGFAVRLFPVAQDYHTWDETVYLQQGEILAGERPDHYNEFHLRPPVISLILGAVFKFSTSLTAAHLTIALVSSMAIPLTFLLGRRLFDSVTGLSAALIYASSPLAVKLSHQILVDPILPVFWLLTALGFLKAVENDKLLYYFMSGFLAGIAVLTKFTSFVLVPILGLLYLYRRGLSIEELDFEGLRSRIINSESVSMASGFSLAMLPYLFWSFIEHGSPIYTLGQAMRLSGAADPFMTYFLDLMVIVLPVFIPGMLLYLTKKDLLSFRTMMPVIFILGLYLTLQFALGNKETRFLMPVLPFISIVAAEGFRQVKPDSESLQLLGVSILVLVALPFMFENLGHRNPVNHGFTVDSWHPPVEEASYWLKNRSDQNSVIYTNYQYPALGYYAERDIVWIREYVELEEMIGEEIDRAGYVYLSEDSPYPHPSREELESDPRFSQIKSFDKKIHLYYFRGLN